MLNLKSVFCVFFLQSSKLRLKFAEEQMNGATVTVYRHVGKLLTCQWFKTLTSKLTGFNHSVWLRCGDTIAVCNGPLLPHTGLLTVFKMLQVCVCVSSQCIQSFARLSVFSFCVFVFHCQFIYFIVLLFLSKSRICSIPMKTVFHMAVLSRFFTLKHYMTAMKEAVPSHQLKSVLFGPSWLSLRWDTCCVSGIFLIHIDPGREESFHTKLPLGRLGFHNRKGLEISAAGCCVCQRPDFCSGLLETHGHPSLS